MILLFGVNQKGLITNYVYFLNVSANSSSLVAGNDSNSAPITTTWLNSFSVADGTNADNTKMTTPTSASQLSSDAIIDIIIGLVLFVRP